MEMYRVKPVFAKKKKKILEFLKFGFIKILIVENTISLNKNTIHLIWLLFIELKPT